MSSPTFWKKTSSKIWTTFQFSHGVHAPLRLNCVFVASQATPGSILPIFQIIDGENLWITEFRDRGSEILQSWKSKNLHILFGDLDSAREVQNFSKAIFKLAR